MQRFRCGASSWGAAGRGRGGEAGGKKAWREAGGVRGGGGGQKGGWRRAEKKVRLGPRGSALRHAGPPSRNGGEEDEQGVGGGGERGKRGEEGKAEEEGARWPLWGTAVSLWRDRRGERGGGRFGNVRGCCFVGRGTTQQPAREEEKKMLAGGGRGGQTMADGRKRGPIAPRAGGGAFHHQAGEKKGMGSMVCGAEPCFRFFVGQSGWIGSGVWGGARGKGRARRGGGVNGVCCGNRCQATAKMSTQQQQVIGQGSVKSVCVL